MNKRTLHDTYNDLIDAIKYAYEECPDSENKTFDEIAHWCGQHVLISEIKES